MKSHESRRQQEQGPEAGSEEQSRQDASSLHNVGRVVWQSGFLLAEYLIRKPPFRDWSGVRVVDIGTGTGTD